MPSLTQWQNRAEDRDVPSRGAFRWLTDLRQDIIYGVRLLRKSPGFATIALLTLALGIGANTAIFSLIDELMLKALPVSNPSQLMLLKFAARKSPNLGSWNVYGDCVTVIEDTSVSGCSLSKPFLGDVGNKTDVSAA